MGETFLEPYTALTQVPTFEITIAGTEGINPNQEKSHHLKLFEKAYTTEPVSIDHPAAPTAVMRIQFFHRVGQPSRLELWAHEPSDDPDAEDEFRLGYIERTSYYNYDYHLLRQDRELLRVQDRTERQLFRELVEAVLREVPPKRKNP